ncbi:TRAP-type mannitol/chloroaromatic compound transport system permease small subunit [Pseudorhodoplanes sinuspersici]|uniref:TRAP transporter small permease protein n=1 Tax=Pseudorhodoplanes sinuspersici TaxID=1235591 RepID=A0A1W6ZRL5_9HYPH|nr:C4-dicarboxylate ABC transporter permease [Pseudorhodoplanes sinuspersici]RKE70935.1 TRAP-type mannitol/chloroaromatic compound transport system permease small subunit [Pseudorhodoplanes sinuspersici]
MNSVEKLAHGIDAFVDLVGRATSWLALGIALVMGANVLLRYAFSYGFIWAQELEWHIFVPICLFGMSYALLHGEHVRVDVLFQYYTPRNKHLVEVISAFISMAFCVIVIWLSIPYVYQSWSIGEGTANPGGIDYRYIVKSLIPIGFAILFLQSLSEAIKNYIAMRRA